MLGSRLEGAGVIWSKTRLIIRIRSSSIIILRFQQRLEVSAVSLEV